MPFCPKCRDEFQDWVEVCPDCHVELVDILPEPPSEPKRQETTAYDPLVTIATYNYPMEAHLGKAKLESEGFDSVVFDEHMIITNWLYSIAIGGVKLKVRESDAKDASQILDCIPAYIPEKVSQAAVSIDEERCLKCHSVDIRYEVFHIRVIFILWFVFALLGFAFSPSTASFTLPVFKKKWKCRNCGYEWKEKKP